MEDNIERASMYKSYKHLFHVSRGGKTGWGVETGIVYRLQESEGFEQCQMKKIN